MERERGFRACVFFWGGQTARPGHALLVHPLSPASPSPQPPPRSPSTPPPLRPCAHAGRADPGGRDARADRHARTASSPCHDGGASASACHDCSASSAVDDDAGRDAGAIDDAAGHHAGAIDAAGHHARAPRRRRRPPPPPPPPIPILVTVLRFTGVSVWPFDDAKSAALAVALAKAVAGVGAPRNVAVIGAVALPPPARRPRKMLQLEEAPIGADVAVALRAAGEAGAAAIGAALPPSTPALRAALAEGGVAVDAIDISSSTVATASSSLLFSCASGSVGGVCLPSPPLPRPQRRRVGGGRAGRSGRGCCGGHHPDGGVEAGACRRGRGGRGDNPRPRALRSTCALRSPCALCSACAAGWHPHRAGRPLLGGTGGGWLPQGGGERGGGRDGAGWVKSGCEGGVFFVQKRQEAKISMLTLIKILQTAGDRARRASRRLAVGRTTSPNSNIAKKCFFDALQKLGRLTGCAQGVAVV